MDYLKRVLGIHTVYQNEESKAIPNFIDARYRLQKVTLDGKQSIFLYPKTELDSINAVKKHMERVEKTEHAPAVLILNRLSYRQKEYLLRDHIPFIVEGKQIYLPFMAIYLQERCDGESHELTALLPSSQLLLLFYIYHGCGEMTTSEATRALGFTSTSISRASRQLEELGLIKTEKRGVQKLVLSDYTPKELFVAAKGYMLSPVKRAIYVSQERLNENLLLSGYSALAEYTMINPPGMKTVASESVAAWEAGASHKLQNAEDQVKVELWRYDPGRLVTNECVDRLSLALALKDDRDERVEDAVKGMLEKVWEEIDGKRT